MLQKCINSKQKTVKKKDNALCLGNISKDFTADNMKKKTGLKGVVKFNATDINNILYIHKNLMEKIWHKIMFGSIKKICYGLLAGLVNGWVNVWLNFTAIHLRLN